MGNTVTYHITYCCHRQFHQVFTNLVVIPARCGRRIFATFGAPFAPRGGVHAGGLPGQSGGHLWDEHGHLQGVCFVDSEPQRWVLSLSLNSIYTVNGWRRVFGVDITEISRWSCIWTRCPWQHLIGLIWRRLASTMASISTAWSRASCASLDVRLLGICLQFIFLWWFIRLSFWLVG